MANLFSPMLLDCHLRKLSSFLKPPNRLKLSNISSTLTDNILNLINKSNLTTPNSSMLFISPLNKRTFATKLKKMISLMRSSSI